MIVAMQVLWYEALGGNCLITVYEFLYCYKPSKIKQSAGFYQLSSRSPQFSLIKGRSSSDRLWKTEFFIIHGNWVGDLVVINSAPFPPFTSPLVVFVLRICLSSFVSFIFFPFFTHLTFFCIGVAVTHPHLGDFYLEHIDRVCAFLG